MRGGLSFSHTVIPFFVERKRRNTGSDASGFLALELKWQILLETHLWISREMSFFLKCGEAVEISIALYTQLS